MFDHCKYWGAFLVAAGRDATAGGLLSLVYLISEWLWTFFYYTNVEAPAMHPFFRSDIPILDIAPSKCWNINLCWRSKRSSLILSLTCILELDCKTLTAKRTYNWKLYFPMGILSVRNECCTRLSPLLKNEQFNIQVSAVCFHIDEKHRIYQFNTREF